MFNNTALKNHFQNSPTIQSKSKIVAEWNMNMPDNIFKLGNYRYRPQSSDTRYLTIQSTFDANDVGQFYTGATDADVVVDGGVDDDDNPILYTATKEQLKLYYSLEDCIKPFRPRSGINKTSYIPGRYVPSLTTDALNNQGSFFTQRPRYYMPDRNDEFKYWTSYRTEKESTSSANTTERGISNRLIGQSYYLDDAAPFVVYKNNVPSNRVIVKMQTNVGGVNLGPYQSTVSTLADPFYGIVNKTTPTIWKIQILKGNQWVTVQDFNFSSTRPDGSPIVPDDGYVELSYGLKVPDKYKERFIHAETLTSESLLPNKSIDGYSYLVITSSTDKGTYHIWNSLSNEYEQFVPEHTWFLTDDSLDQTKHFVTNLTSPSSYIEPETSQIKYREFEYIKGIRIVVDSMNKFNSSFDLIEFSPRLNVDISDRVVSYNVTKSLGDLGSGALPIGQLLASTGTINIFDEDQSFNENSNSLIANYIRKNVKFTFYENIINVYGYDYLVPIKTLYSEGFPQADVTGGTISIKLRDLYFYFESMPAPELFITNVSLSYAIALLLDYVGFSNYIYKRNVSDIEPVIPYFFVSPDKNLAQILNDLAISTQTAMFFDEYNNFVVMSKDYLMPSASERSINYELIGSKVTDKVSEIVILTDDGESPTSTSQEELDAGFYNTNFWTEELGQGSASLVENTANIIQNKIISGKKLANIISMASQDKKIYNDGKITYKTRYIDKIYSQLGQETSISSEDKSWIYKPSALWQIQDTKESKIGNGSGGYSLAALVLNKDLSNLPPTVQGGVIQNNVADFGESAYLLVRYQGYFYANGEVIKYDAVEYNVAGTGNVWINNDAEYKYYLSNMPFNGKIYHTGRVRIYSEPYYELVSGTSRMKEGAVISSGRAQFGTQIAYHTAGLLPEWVSYDNRKGCVMESQYLFGESPFAGSTTTGSAGVNNDLAKKSTANSVVKKYLGKSNLTENEILTTNTINPQKHKGVIQSSALVLKGPNFTSTDPNPTNFITLITKSFQDRYNYFGTRIRIIGGSVGEIQDENNDSYKTLIPLDGSIYYQIPTDSPNQPIKLSGNSGGLGVLVNAANNNGYYFEIISLDGGTEEQANIIFYKIKKDSSSTKAIPELLWSGNGDILSDSGNFVGVSKKFEDKYTTVYDLAVEYVDNALGQNSRRFYLYINNVLIATVDDKDPLPKSYNTALFTRGGSKCMFEHLLAMGPNYSTNGATTITDPISKVFSGNSISIKDSLRKYALSGVLQDTYLSGVGPGNNPNYKIFYDEFGTIMRECAYLNVRFDNAYPALSSQILKPQDRVKDFTISNYQSNAYGAEFLIFNSTDSLLDLGTTSFNFLNIVGIAFTQDNTNTLTVDDYFKKTSSFSDQELKGNAIVYSPVVEEQKYNTIKNSRIIYGKNEFSIESDYIQTSDDAENLMGWIISKLMQPKKSVGIEMFATPIVQLGDIVTIDYKNNDGVDMVATTNTRFIVYNIEYNRNNSGPSMTVYLSEV